MLVVDQRGEARHVRQEREGIGHLCPVGDSVHRVCGRGGRLFAETFLGEAPPTWWEFPEIPPAPARAPAEGPLGGAVTWQAMVRRAVCRSPPLRGSGPPTCGIRTELRQELCSSPADVALETVRAWAVWQTEVERRSCHVLLGAKPDAGRGRISVGCSAPSSAKTAGKWPKSWGYDTVWRPASVGACPVGCRGGPQGLARLCGRASGRSPGRARPR